MATFQVHSIPLKDVIMSLANSFGVAYSQNCDEYSVEIPKNIGKGEIRGINFENGLGLLLYKATFKEDIRLEFTLDQVHPVKYIYSLHGPLAHSFSNDSTKNFIEEFSCAILASEKNSGHIMEFSKDIAYEVISVEIDRKNFLPNFSCEINAWNSTLQSLFKDIHGEVQFYHEGTCGIYFKDILQDVDHFEHFPLARKINLQSIAMQIFINQLVQVDDDLLNTELRSILRIKELKRVEEIAEFIKENLTTDLSIKNLSRETGLNPNKLQLGFKYLFNATINEYVTNARLDQANILLKNKEFNVGAVVSAIGLESSSYFSKIYKKKYGITPKNYKKIFS